MSETERYASPPPALAGASVADIRSVMVRRWQGSRTAIADNPFSDARVRHVIGGEPATFRAQMEWAIAKAMSGRTAQLSELFAAEAAVVWDSLHRSAEKAAILDHFDELARRAGIDRRSANDLGEILEEMVTNALYNAPVLDGEPAFAHLGRHHPVRSERPVAVAFIQDAAQVGIMVRDHFGSLSPARILESLARCFAEDRVAVRESGGGAGLGLYRMVQSASRVVFNLHPGESTEVIVARPLKMRRAELQKTVPTIHILCQGTPSFEELRRDRRRPVHWMASCAAQFRPETRGVVVNASPRGLFVALDPAMHRLVPGDAVQLAVCPTLSPGSVSLPQSAPVMVWEYSAAGDEKILQAEVRWVGADAQTGQRGIGVELSADSPDLDLPGEE